MSGEKPHINCEIFAGYPRLIWPRFSSNDFDSDKERKKTKPNDQ